MRIIAINKHPFFDADLSLYRIVKKIQLFLASLILLSGCGASAVAPDANDTAITQRPDGLKADMGKSDAEAAIAPGEPDRLQSDGSEFTDSTKVREILSFLASDELQGRDSGSEGIEAAARYIENVFEENGLKPFYTSFRDTLLNYNLPAYNLVAMVPGTDEELADEFIVIGAHYDHVGIIGKGPGDVIANGANDNASGTAVVLEIARYFGTAKTNKRSLLFALFTAEEKGLLGSVHLSKCLKENDFNMVAMLNFEMIGVPMTHNEYLLYLTGYNRSNLAEFCNEYAGEKLVGFLPQAKEYQLFQRSDNYPFHKDFTVPSQTFCSFDFTNYDYYHKVEDEAFRLDYPHMAKVINKMIPVIEKLSNVKEQHIKYY